MSDPLFRTPTETAKSFGDDIDGYVVVIQVLVFHLFHFIVRLLVTDICLNAVPAGLLEHVRGKKRLLTLLGSFVKTLVIVVHRIVCAGCGI